jgi:hypothetical protein
MIILENVSETCSFQYKLTNHFKLIRLLKQDSYFKIIEVKISNQTSAVQCQGMKDG